MSKKAQQNKKQQSNGQRANALSQNRTLITALGVVILGAVFLTQTEALSSLWIIIFGVVLMNAWIVVLQLMRLYVRSKSK